MNFLYFSAQCAVDVAALGRRTLLDRVPGRDAGKTYEMLDALGAVGREHHLYFIWTIDLALPLLFGWSLYVAIGNGATWAFGESRAAGRFRWLAVAAAVSDYLENLSNTVLLVSYPERLSTLASLSGLLTLIKFSLYGASVLVAVSMFSVAFVRRRKTRP